MGPADGWLRRRSIHGGCIHSRLGRFASLAGRLVRLILRCFVQRRVNDGRSVRRVLLSRSPSRYFSSMIRNRTRCITVLGEHVQSVRVMLKILGKDSRIPLEQGTGRSNHRRVRPKRLRIVRRTGHGRWKRSPLWRRTELTVGPGVFAHARLVTPDRTTGRGVSGKWRSEVYLARTGN